jgi:hypothetical protein
MNDRETYESKNKKRYIRMWLPFALSRSWRHARRELRSTAVSFRQLVCLSRVNMRMKARTTISMFSRLLDS